MSSASSYNVIISGDTFVVPNLDENGKQILYTIHCVDDKAIDVPAGILKEMYGLVASNFSDGPTTDLYIKLEDGIQENVLKIVNYYKYVGGETFDFDHLYMTKEEEAKHKEDVARRADLLAKTDPEACKHLPKYDFSIRSAKIFPQTLEDTKSMDYMANILAPNTKPGVEIVLEDTDQLYNDKLFELADALGCVVFMAYSYSFVARLVQRTNLIGTFNDDSDERVIKHFNYAYRYTGSVPRAHKKHVIDPAQLPPREEILALRKKYNWVFWKEQVGSNVADAQVFKPINI